MDDDTTTKPDDGEGVSANGHGGLFEIADCRFDLARRSLWRGETRVRLTPRTAFLLGTLAEQAGEVVSRESLNALRTDGLSLSANGIHKSVVELRQALSTLGADFNAVETVPRRGYRLTLPVRRVGQVMAEAQGDAAVDHVLRHHRGEVIRPPRVTDAPDLSQPASQSSTSANRWQVPGWKAAVVTAVFIASGFGLLWLSDGGLEDGTRPGTADDADLAGQDSMQDFEPRTGARIGIVDLVVPDPDLDAVDASLRPALDDLHEQLRSAIVAWPGVRMTTRMNPGVTSDQAFRIDFAAREVSGRLSVEVTGWEISRDAMVYRERYQTSASELSGSTKRIIADVVSVLPILADDKALHAMEAAGTRHVRAWQALLEGRVLLEPGGRAARAFAADSFRAAVAIDPEFSQGWSELYGVISESSRIETDPDRRITLRRQLDWLNAIEMPRSKRRLDWSAVGHAMPRNFRLTLRNLERELRYEIVRCTDHGCTSGYIPSYSALLVSGRLDTEARKLLQLEKQFARPAYPVYLHLAEAESSAAPAAQRVVALQRLLAATPEHVPALFDMTQQLVAEGRLPDAERYLRRLRVADGGEGWYRFGDALVSVLRMRLEEPSQKRSDGLMQGLTPFMRGVVHFMLGEVAAGATQWAHVDPIVEAEFLLWVPLFESLYPDVVRADPRYQSALDSIDMGQQWTAELRKVNGEVIGAFERYLEGQQESAVKPAGPATRG